MSERCYCLRNEYEYGVMHNEFTISSFYLAKLIVTSMAKTAHCERVDVFCVVLYKVIRQY